MSDASPDLGEDRARKRRWLNLAEWVAVAGVLIAAAGLYLTWSDRRDRVVADTQAARVMGRFEIRATPAKDGDALVLTPDDRHEMQEAMVTFPATLGVAPQDALAGRIERDWFAKPLLKATDGGADDRTGALPVLIRVRYADGDATGSASGIYDIVWRTDGRTFPFGRSLKLEALRLRERGGSAARLDALWHPAKR